MTDPRPQTINQQELELMAQRRAKAVTEMQRICSGDRRWTMCIPVQEDDSDMVIGASLDDLERLIGEVYRLRGVLKKLHLETLRDQPESRRIIYDALFNGKEETSARDVS
jgi:hypothetical protein